MRFKFLELSCLAMMAALLASCMTSSPSPRAERPDVSHAAATHEAGGTPPPSPSPAAAQAPAASASGPAAAQSRAPKEPAKKQDDPLRWNDWQRKNVDEASLIMADDPVGAALKLQRVRNHTTPSPTAQQIAWLEERLKTVKPSAKEIVLKDFEAAADASDLREMALLGAVAEDLEKEFLPAAARIAEVKSRISTGASKERHTWSLSGVSGKFQEGYSEGTLRVSPKTGFRIFRVSGTAANKAATGDKAYVKEVKGLWANPPRVPEGQLPKPFRWISDNDFSLLTPGGDSIPSSLVCAFCQLAGGISMQIEGIGKITPPQGVVCGESITFDLLFSVPEGIDRFRLQLAGAAAVAVPLGS